MIDVPGGGLPEGTVAIKPLTRAGYNALTDEEKQADVVYAITDDPPVSGSSWEVYSEKEVRIGTWVDGKPIYKISLIRDSFTVTGSRGDINFPDVAIIDTLVDGVASFKDGNSKRIGEVYVAIMGGKLVVTLIHAASVTGRLVVTILYTKTTDTGGAV